MKKFLLALVLMVPMLVGCGQRNPVAGTTWIGENQYYYDVITFSEDSLIYSGIDVNGNVVVPQVKMPYKWRENDIDAFYSYLDTIIVNRPLAFDSVKTFNFISGFNADDVENGHGTLRVWRYWSENGNDWEQEDVDFESISYYKAIQDTQDADSPSEIIKNINYHRLLAILSDRHYVRENDFGATSKNDYYLLQKYRLLGQIDSIKAMLSNGRITCFDGKWFVRGDSATADYVLVTKERGGEKYYVDWATLVNYSGDNTPTTYHNAFTGKSQASYGGSREQLRDLDAADASLTDYEKSIEAEYERQVERELREMESW